jgi:hypothetical protein
VIAKRCCKQLACAKVVLKLIQDCDNPDKDVETTLNKTTFD